MSKERTRGKKTNTNNRVRGNALTKQHFNMKRNIIKKENTVLRSKAAEMICGRNCNMNIQIKRLIQRERTHAGMKYRAKTDTLTEKTQTITKRHCVESLTRAVLDASLSAVFWPRCGTTLRWRSAPSPWPLNLGGVTNYPSIKGHMTSGLRKSLPFPGFHRYKFLYPPDRGSVTRCWPHCTEAGLKTVRKWTLRGMNVVQDSTCEVDGKKNAD